MNEEKKTLKVKVTEKVQAGKAKAKAGWDKVKKPLGVIGAVAAAGAVGYGIGKIKTSESVGRSGEFDDPELEALLATENEESNSDVSDIEGSNF